MSQSVGRGLLQSFGIFSSIYLSVLLSIHWKLGGVVNQVLNKWTHIHFTQYSLDLASEKQDHFSDCKLIMQTDSEVDSDCCWLGYWTSYWMKNTKAEKKVQDPFGTSHKLDFTHRSHRY